MKKLFILFTILTLIISCSERHLDVKPSIYLSSEQQVKLKLDIIRYIDDLAKYATNENKFDTIFDLEYQRKAKAIELMLAYKAKDSDTLFFAVAKIAPSIKLKKVATVGKLVYDKNQKIIFYAEGFRTWKMEVPELKTTTDMLFQKYIQGDDLSEFHTKNSKGKFIIEFPDDNNYFDSNKRAWIFKQAQ